MYYYRVRQTRWRAEGLEPLKADEKYNRASMLVSENVVFQASLNTHY